MTSFSPKVPNVPSKKKSPFLILGPLQKRVNAPNVGAIFKKYIWNPTPYRILGKLLKFHANWIINKKVIKRKPTGGPRRNRVKRQ